MVLADVVFYRDEPIRHFKVLFCPDEPIKKDNFLACFIPTVIVLLLFIHMQTKGKK